MTENPLDSNSGTEKKIQERAYYLWLEEGCPEGRDQDHWERARALQAMTSAGADNAGAGTGRLPNPMKRHPFPIESEVIEDTVLHDNLGEFAHAGLVNQEDRAEIPAARHKPRPVSKGTDQEQEPATAHAKAPASRKR